MNIKAFFPSGATQLTVNGLHQWDYGRKIEVHADDLPALVEVHFACAGMSEAVVRSCAVIDGIAEAAVPDQCLEQTTPITAWVYEVGETSGETVKTITLPIIPRARPKPGAPIPREVSDKYTEAVAAMTALVEQVEESVNDVSEEVYSNVARDITGGSLKVEKATQAEYAERDGRGDIIHETYASRQDLLSGGVKVKSATRSDAAGTATRAEQDGEGNNIVDTYQRKSNICRSFTSMSQDVTATNTPFAIGTIPEGKHLTSINAVAFKILSTHTGVTHHFQGIVDYPIVTDSTEGEYLAIDCVMSLVSYGSKRAFGNVEARFYAEGDTLKMSLKDARGINYTGSSGTYEYTADSQIFAGTLKGIAVYYN